MLSSNTRLRPEMYHHCIFN